MMTTDTTMIIDHRDPDSKTTVIDPATATATLGCTEKETETETVAETTNDGVSTTTGEETAIATTTMTVAVTPTTDSRTGTGAGTERERGQETEIDKVDKPTGLLHATPLTTAVGLQLQPRGNLCPQPVGLRRRPARYPMLLINLT